MSEEFISSLTMIVVIFVFLVLVYITANWGKKILYC